MDISKKLIISIDFDGTITKSTGKFPIPGEVRPEAIEYINNWYDRGHTIIISSCRAGGNAPELCLDFLKKWGIKYHFFNENSPININFFGTDTRKISADFYIDDRSMTINWDDFDTHISKLEKPTFICLIGPSGSGKTLSADYIKDTYNINLVRSYTTRKPRFDGENCHTFLSNEEFDLLETDNMLAPTSYGNDRYCSMVDDVEYKNVYVVSEESFDYFKWKWGKLFNIYSIRLCRDEKLRMEKVDIKRIERDRGMLKKKISVDNFDYIIFNNSSKEYLFDHIDKFMTKFRLQ